MTGVTDQTARAIAFLATACRPVDAPTWDTPGIVAKVVGDERPLVDVVLDVIACAMDPEARTPGAIGKRHWRTRLTAVAPSGGPKLPKPDEATCACGRVGYHRHDETATREQRQRRADEARGLLRKTDTKPEGGA